MSGGLVAGVMTAVVLGAAYGGIVWWSIRRARSTYSTAIVRQMKSTGRPVVIRVSDRRGTWNPARKEVSGRLFANGVAQYSLDESGTVHLRFTPAAGPDQLYEGAIPTWHDSPEGRRRRRLLRRFWVVYVLWLLIGFGTGLAVAGGSTARHLVFAVGGLFLFMLLASLGTTAIQVVLAVRTTLRERAK